MAPGKPLRPGGKLRKRKKRKPKSRLQTQKDNVSSNYWKAKADKLWSLCIRECGHCEICGPGKNHKVLHAHHLIHCDARFFRHDLNNGISLCAHHHRFDINLSAHGAPWAFDYWMQKNRPEQHRWWFNHRWTVTTGEKVNYKQAYERLQQTLGLPKID